MEHIYNGHSKSWVCHLTGSQLMEVWKLLLCMQGLKITTLVKG